MDTLTPASTGPEQAASPVGDRAEQVADLETRLGIRPDFARAWAQRMATANLVDVARWAERGTGDRPEHLTDDQASAARAVIGQVRCPRCGVGTTNTKAGAGTYRSITGAFLLRVFNCGSELTLRTFNPDNGRCVVGVSDPPA